MPETSSITVSTINPVSLKKPCDAAGEDRLVGVKFILVLMSANVFGVIEFALYPDADASPILKPLPFTLGEILIEPPEGVFNADPICVAGC